MSRLEVVKKIFQAFVMGDGRDLAGRPNDLIGMISFARYPDTICPLTLAHGALPPFLDSVKLAQTRTEDGTTIGDALALAAARLKTVDETLSQQRGSDKKSYKIESKIIILLSDGENNSGKRDPIQAAELAKKWGIKIYTIAIGSGEVVTSIKTPFGEYKVPVRQQVDTAALKTVAEKTGGLFRKADNAKALLEIYKEIDKLEKSEIESIRFIDYKESFIYFALAGLIIIGCEIILSATFFRKIP
jgi:Ca-activated chloride channel family protein